MLGLVKMKVIADLMINGALAVFNIAYNVEAL